MTLVPQQERLLCSGDMAVTANGAGDPPGTGGRRSPVAPFRENPLKFVPPLNCSRRRRGRGAAALVPVSARFQPESRSGGEPSTLELCFHIHMPYFHKPLLLMEAHKLRSSKLADFKGTREWRSAPPAMDAERAATPGAPPAAAAPDIPSPLPRAVLGARPWVNKSCPRLSCSLVSGNHVGRFNCHIFKPR